jgi:starch phosphorylase
MLRALGYRDVGTYHMNEGHTAFLTLELLRERQWQDEAVRSSCAFTTHTPIQAGHDIFPYDLVSRIAGDNLPWHIRKIAGEKELQMTLLAMNMSKFTCGVSKIHAEVSRQMFPGVSIGAVTNGIHHVTWSSPEMQQLFDRYSEGWRSDPSVLTTTCRDYPDAELWAAHQAAKARLITEVNRRTSQKFDQTTLTIASARRVVAYKQPELLYAAIERLADVCRGRVQIIHSGNAHPADLFAQGVIQRMIERSRALKDQVKIAYLENYNPDLARLLTQGADVWLNTPMRLHEASGTSGMKACLNGVLNLSTLDGWWIEGYGLDPEAGWRIGPLVQAVGSEESRVIDAEDIYTQLQYEVVPEYEYEGRARWIRRMKRAIGLIGYFNTHRCVREYLEKAWK